MLAAVSAARELAGPPRLPMRLEHAANLQLTAEIIAEMRDLNVVPVPTANFMSTDDGSGLYGFGTLIAEGFEPPGNSDTGGAIAEAPNPWFGAAHLIERKNAHGVEVAPSEAIDAYAGLKTYTDFAAAVAGHQSFLGKLRAGYAADFAVYDSDPRELDPHHMKQVKARMTFVRGSVTWDRERMESGHE